MQSSKCYGRGLAADGHNTAGGGGAGCTADLRAACSHHHRHHVARVWPAADRLQRHRVIQVRRCRAGVPEQLEPTAVGWGSVAWNMCIAGALRLDTLCCSAVLVSQLSAHACTVLHYLHAASWQRLALGSRAARYMHQTPCLGILARESGKPSPSPTGDRSLLQTIHSSANHS
jgi:hypothetical protein